MAAALRQHSREQHMSFPVSVLDLLHFDPALAYHLLHNPLPLLDIFETAVQQLIDMYRELPEVKRQQQQQQQQSPVLLQALGGRGGGGGGQYHVRLWQLPPTPELTKATIGLLRVSADSQHLLQVTGTVSADRTGGGGLRPGSVLGMGDFLLDNIRKVYS
jgi:DNA replicative helicase MCM subunit Mcm2 (Cdc46/Mcm family)